MEIHEPLPGALQVHIRATRGCGRQFEWTGYGLLEVDLLQDPTHARVATGKQHMWACKGNPTDSAAAEPPPARPCLYNRLDDPVRLPIEVDHDFTHLNQLDNELSWIIATHPMRSVYLMIASNPSAPLGPAARQT